MTIANHDQAAHWNSAAQASRWVSHQKSYDRMLAPFADLVLRAADLAAGQHVLDVGCGCGTTTLHAARSIAPGMAAGIDLSEPMLARARHRAASSAVANVSFIQGDAQTQPFAPTFDVVISRFGVMFFADPAAAFSNLRAATRRGGRLAFACWQPLAANEWLTVPCAAVAGLLPVPDLGDPGGPGMFSLAEPDRIRAVLASAGWRGVSVTAERTPILVGGGPLDDAVAFWRTGPVGRRLLDGADAATQARAVDAVRAALASRGTDQGVRLEAAVWLVRADA